MFSELRRRLIDQKITQVTNLRCNTQNTSSGIDANIVSYLSNKYKPTDFDESSMATLRIFIRPVCLTLLQQPIIYDEHAAVLRAGPRHPSPAIDGLSFEFYSVNWEIMCSELYNS
jgi:F420-0:gamma-glutamyl ligase